MSRAGLLIQLLSSMLIVGWTIGLVLLVYFPRFLQRQLPSSPGSKVSHMYSPHSRSGRNTEIGKKKRRILLLVAHPDDECMFFGPTLLSITMMQPATCELRVLCISTGNADGLGERRKSEMLASCIVLKVPAENVEVLDHPALQDGHTQVWSQQLLVNIIDQRVKSQEIDTVITFDSYGVSGHPNHIALASALRDYLRDCKRFQIDADVPHVECWELVSLNIARKYSGMLEVCSSTLGWLISTKKSRIHCFLTPNPLISVAAMKQHESQWVWFRRLFVVFAAYTYVNVLRKIESQRRAVTKSKEEKIE